MAKTLNLSATSLKEIKCGCLIAYRNRFVLGVRKIVESVTRRVGTNWHRGLEILGKVPGSPCCKNPECVFCAGVGIVSDPFASIQREFDRAYAGLLGTADILVERVILLYSLVAYRHVYQNQDIEVLATELNFNLPLLNPETGRAYPNVRLKGKIDKLVRYHGQVCVFEHKSTSDDVDPASNYWKHLPLDTQSTLYLYAARRLQALGELAQYGILPGDPQISCVYYDVWHKPGIRPKKLTQGESKQFVEDGLYCGQTFVIGHAGPEGQGDSLVVTVGGTPAEIEPGAKPGTFAIRETPEMFGARLLLETCQQPDKYFARKEIARTEDQMRSFETMLDSIYHQILFLRRTDGWYPNEDKCEATYKCEYIDLCYNNVVIDVNNLPAEYECIYLKGKPYGTCDPTPSSVIAPAVLDPADDTGTEGPAESETYAQPDASAVNGSAGEKGQGQG